MKSLEEKIEMLEKQIFRLKEKVSIKPKPTINSYKDASKLLNPTWFIDSTGTIYQYETQLFIKSDCGMTSENQAKRAKAFIKLHLISEAMNQGVECNRRKYIVLPAFNMNNDLIVKGRREDEANETIYPLFNSKSLAQEAKRKFEPLFRELYGWY